MRFFEGAAAVPPGFGPSAVAIGKFDGVHLGHRAGLEMLTSIAADRGLASVVVTFDRHPLALLDPERCPPALVSRRQRVEALESTPLDALLELPFTPELANLDADRFVEQYLIDLLGARVVLAGADFRFGHRGAGSVDTLRDRGAERGFEVVVLDSVEVDGSRVSSTRIRQHLDAGEVRAAARLLGRRPRVRATVVGGDRIGREIGFPTANLDPDMEGFLPADGVYAVWAHVPQGRFGAALSIGNNPTFEGVPARRTEAHLFDFAGDLYGQPIEIEFVDYLRPMYAFPSVEALIDALTDDAARIREILAADAAAGSVTA